jgi:hypothetical protein
MRNGISSSAWLAVCLAVGCLTGCAPPTDVVDLRNTPQATWDAMLQVQILPIGMPAPGYVGSVGPVAGFGCGPTPVAASGDAVNQLRIKALRMRATAIMDVVIQSGPTGTCFGGHTALANGTAVAHRGLSDAY